MALSYISKILYDSKGHTGNIYYARFVKKSNGRIWDNVNEELAADPNWEDSAIPLVETGTTGQYPVVVPADLPKCVYDIIIYLRAGSVPQSTDDVELQYDAAIGSIFGF